MPQTYKTLPIVWIAMLIAVLILTGITFSGVMPVQSSDGLVPWVLAVPAVGSAGMAVVGVRLLMGHMPAQSAYIVRFAFAESVAIYGMVAYLQGAPMAMAAGYFVLSLICMVACRPTPDGFTAWEMRREER